MAEVRRYSGQSYGKVHKQENAASKAFDDIIAKAKAANVKWRNTSYVKPRAEEAVVSKKHKVDTCIEKSNDPFSFDFDSDKSSKKKKTRCHTKTVVLQPTGRITSVASNKVIPAFDNTTEEDLTVTKANVRTYCKGGSIKIKIKHEDAIQIKTDSCVKPRKIAVHDDVPVQGVPQLSSQQTINANGLEDGLYVVPSAYDSTGSQDAYNFFIHEEKEKILKRPKHETSCPVDGEVTVKFHSPYLSPVVYPKFTENVKPRDPVEHLSNSKVIHKNVSKHGSGITPIVVCSPKVGNEELKQSNMLSKYLKDNIKDPVKFRHIPVTQIARGRKSTLPETQKEKDPFDLDDDLYFSVPTAVDKCVNGKTGTHNFISSPIIARQQSQCSTIAKYPKSSQLKSTDIEEIVKSVKQMQPRKYHRIFRSRNKGFMEQQADSYESPIIESTDKSTDNFWAVESKKTSGSHPQTDMCNQWNGESQETENEMATAPSNTQESHQDYGSPIQVLPQLINLTEDKVNCDLGSSVQSDIHLSQSTEATSVSQDLEPQLKKPKILKPPPAERKIFRARGSKPSTMKKIFSSPKKCAAVYNVRSWQDDDVEMSEIQKVPPLFDEELFEMFPDVPPEPPKLKPVTHKQIHEPEAEHTEMPCLKRAVHWQGYHGDDAFTSVHVGKQHRDLFTVVKNVKEAHECQEHGETQEFDDDIEYLLAGIESTEPMSTRCLSCVGLAQKSIIPAFRMHLRAHGTITKIFSCLQDAASDISLALCTSALMFMLSRDRLNMDLDRESLNLMLRLLVVDQQDGMVTTLSATAEQALKRNRDRVQQVYQEFLQQSETKQDALEPDSLCTSNLALESLLSLTSHRAGEWFKEELRTLGALDHIVNTVCFCVASMGDHLDVVTNSIIDNLNKLDRSLRVLETVTYLNADNQNYLISCKDSSLIPSLSRALKTCQTCLSIYPLTETSNGKANKESFGWVVYSSILAILRVLLNLSHENDIGCKKIGEQSLAMETVLLCTLQSPQYVPVDCRFDLYVLSLGLLINLVEHSDDNRSHLLTLQTLPMYQDSRPDTLTLAYMSLIEVFKCKEAAAQQLEQADEPKTPEESSNKGGKWQESDSGMEWVADSVESVPAIKKGLQRPGANENQKGLDDEETFTIALHRAGKHMENSIVAAYVALLIGCLTYDSMECVANLKCHLPQNCFDGMIYMLKKFLGFMNLTSGAGSAGEKSIQRVIQMLEK